MIEGRGGGGGGWHGKKRIMDYTANRVRYSCGRITLFFMNWVGDKTTKDLGSFGSQLIQDFRIQIWFWWPHTVLVLFCHYSCCGVDMSVLWYILIILRGYFSVPLSWFRCINSFFLFSLLNDGLQIYSHPMIFPSLNPNCVEEAWRSNIECTPTTQPCTNPSKYLINYRWRQNNLNKSHPWCQTQLNLPSPNSPHQQVLNLERP